MIYAIVAVLAFILGVGLTWIYKSSVQSRLQSELESLKRSATNQINRL